jgi:uncharacterized membrane protein
MTVDVEVATVVARPLQDVSTYAADPANAPEWYANIRSVRRHDRGPLRVGSRADFVAELLGRRLQYTYEVVELEPGERLVMRAADGPFPMETTYTWARVGLGTRMTLRNTGEPAGFAALVSPVVARAMRRATARDLARLKQRLEGRP